MIYVMEQKDKEKKDMYLGEMVTLFTNNTSDCITLENALKEKGIPYEKNVDITLMKEKGFLSLPMLEVDDKILKFNEAMKYIEDIDK